MTEKPHASASSLAYGGSLTVDEALLAAAKIKP